ncbi:MAG TPA: MFS transporter [Acidimicrobiales bacterium]|nr:MFS transporter [Acidimicrobiales bacterium]
MATTRRDRASSEPDAPTKEQPALKGDVDIDLTAGDSAALLVDDEPISVADVLVESEMAANAGANPFAAVKALSDALGWAGLVPLLILFGLSAVERFDAGAFGILGPEIRHTFHLSNGGFNAVAGLTSGLPIFASVPLGYVADRVNRVRLTQIAALIWGVTAIFTGLAPILLILVLARLAGGIGLLVNEPVHPSLLSDWYEPDQLPLVNAVHRLGAVVGLIGGPIAGLLAEHMGWRPTFVVLAIPTFILVALMLPLKEPRRGATVGIEETPEHIGFAEGYRRVKAIRSLARTWPAAFLFGAGTLQFATLLNQFLDEVYHMSPFARGSVTLVFGIGSFVGLFLGAMLSTTLVAKRGPGWLSVINGAMVVEAAVGIVLMALAPWMGVSIVLATIASIGTTGFLPPYLTMVALVTPPKLRSQAYAYSLIFYALGGIIMGIIAGTIADDHGYRPAMVFLALFVAAGGLVEISARKFVARDIEQATRAEATAHTDALLACSGVDVAYDQVQVLFGVDLEVHEGEIVALLGTNGAGKSTLLKAISGINDPIGGSIVFDGRDITHADANQTARFGIVQVPGGRGVFPTLSVGENLRVAGWMFRKDPAYVKEATDRVIEYFPILKTRWDTAAGSLSGGEQQMLSLAQAFIAKPKLLLIDELSLGLAPTVVERLLEIVRAIHANGTTVILVEQSVNTALRLAQRAVFMEKGEVRFSGPTAELLHRTDILRAVFLKGAAAAAEEQQAEPSSSSSRSSARASKRAAAEAAKADAERRDALLERPVVLETLNLTKRYGGINAVNGVDLQLHQDQILGLIGPNGAGKTTLFDLICGFTEINAGHVILDGTDVTAWSPDRRALAGMGRSFQDARLWTALTVKEAVAVGFERDADAKGALPALLGLPVVQLAEYEIEERVEDLIELMGLGAFRDKFISELSTGSRRMVEIATILAHHPKVLLLDEPSSGIAQKETEALGPLLREVQKHLGCSILVIEHDMPLITGLADHLMALDRGTVVTFGVPTDVLHHPTVVEAYLGAAATDETHLLDE